MWEPKGSFKGVYKGYYKGSILEGLRLGGLKGFRGSGFRMV